VFRSTLNIALRTNPHPALRATSSRREKGMAESKRDTDQIK
jgi:hypothetical protein